MRAAHRYLALTVILISVIVLTGWLLDNDGMKSVVPGMISMKINTAFGLILLAVALLGLDARAKAWRIAVPLCLAVVTVFSLMTLSEYVFRVDLKIDNWLIYDHASKRFPGRNAPATNAAFLGLVAALLLLYIRQAMATAQMLLLIVTAAPLAGLGGYLYRTPGMYQDAPYPVIALNTAIALMLLCLSALFARSDEALMGIITSHSTAGSMARKLVPAAFILPLLTGLLVLGGEGAGLYTVAFGSALLVACCAMFFAAAVCWTMTVLWKTDLRRAEAERELQRLFQAERDARSDAERANRLKDEFLSVVSHELRTPLNAMLGWSQVLRMQNGPDFNEGLEIIERNGQAQKQIIEDLLDMSRIMSGKIRLDVRKVDLLALVAAAVASMKPAADAKGVRIHSSVGRLVEPIIGDPARLQQVLWNLLSNAIKFTGKGGRVRVVVERLHASVEFRVIDTGEGITGDMLPFVFDRFRQGDASTTRRHGGLGLGLSIVKQLVELHGGTVVAKSDGQWHGTTFIVDLPLNTLHLAPPPPEMDARLRNGGTPKADPNARADVSNLRVLVVDDEADARALVRRFLEDARARVTTADSADAALALMQTNTFDVLVSDVGMPDQDGYSLIRRVRELGSEIPAIALTAYARAEDQSKSLAAGFQIHMAKPVDAIELVNMVSLSARQATPTPLRP